MTEAILPSSRSAAKETGALFYFTGSPCKHGHISKRHTKSGSCMACVSVYRSENKEKIILARRRWLASNREIMSAHNKKYRMNNKEKCSEYSARWYSENKDRKRAKSRERYLEKRDEILRVSNAWSKANRNKKAACCRNRRALKRSADGSHSAEDVKKIRKMQNDKCAYCGIKLNGKGHVDHITSLAKGGDNSPRNLQILCMSCNCTKNARDPIEYVRTHHGMLV